MRTFFLLALLLTAPAFAQEIKKPERAIPLPEEQEAPVDTNTVEVTPAPDTSVKVSPPGCDFEIAFPAEPYSSRRCPDGANGQCYALTRYTMVYEMQTTVDVKVSCNPLSPGHYEQYDEEVTRMALNGMAARVGVQQSTTQYTQENAVKRTTLSGTGMTGRQNKIYVAQIWTAPQSIFTLEAELIGPEHPQADLVFSEILKSIKMKTPEAAGGAAADPKPEADPAPESSLP